MDINSRIFEIDYAPHRHQWAFHQSPARFRALIAGTRGGKTVAGANETIRLAITHPKSWTWIVAPTYPMIRDIDVREIFRWLPRELIRSWNKTEHILELINGSIIQFKSAEDPDTLRGVGLDYLWIDESSFAKRYAWEILYARLTDKAGRCIVTTTPQGYDWVYEDFWLKSLEDPDYYCVRFHTNENPYIPKDIVEKAKKALDPITYRREYEASFEYFKGRVYDDFRRETHVIEPIELNEAWTRVVGIDPGVDHPFAAIWIAIDWDGRFYIYDEHVYPGQPASFHSKAIKLKNYDKRLERSLYPSYFCDPSAAGMILELSQYGINCIPANNDVTQGINKIAELLKTSTITKKPRLFIFKNCLKTIKEFEQYRYIEQREGSNNSKDRVYKFNDDCMDGLRYAVMSQLDSRIKENDKVGLSNEQIVWKSVGKFKKKEYVDPILGSEF